MNIVIIILIVLSFIMVVVDWKDGDKQSSLTFFIAGLFLIFCYVSLRLLSN